jgi:primosomal protein N' (replication factor Y)
LVRGGAEGGSVIAVGESSSRALQALVRLDPRGSALRELAERAEAHFPPAAKLITVEGRLSALAQFTDLAVLPDPTEVLGPVEVATPPTAEEAVHRLALRSPLGTGADLVRATKQATSVRSAKKYEGALRVRVDPVAID